MSYTSLGKGLQSPPPQNYQSAPENVPLEDEILVGKHRLWSFMSVFGGCTDALYHFCFANGSQLSSQLVVLDQDWCTEELQKTTLQTEDVLPKRVGIGMEGSSFWNIDRFFKKTHPSGKLPLFLRTPPPPPPLLCNRRTRAEQSNRRLLSWRLFKAKLPI